MRFSLPAELLLPAQRSAHHRRLLQPYDSPVQTPERSGSKRIQAARRASEHLLSRQNPSRATGAPNSPPTPLWNRTTSCSSSGSIRRGRRLEPANRALIDKAVRAILRAAACPTAASTSTQGPAEVSATVKAYFALKLAGMSRRRSAHGAGARTASSRSAAFRPPTATSRSTSACSDLYPARVLSRLFRRR